MTTKPRRPIRSPFHEFVNAESASGALLVVCAAIALTIANSPWGDRYRSLLASTISVTDGTHGLSLTIHAWINDALMALFFLHVGLEIKRELIAGELASPRRAALPIAAALGGMVVPALFYIGMSPGGLAARGWAIPIATDIAFALGILSLVAPQAPSGLKVFLAALAIVDDLGAVTVIAIFYSAQFAWAALAKASLTLLGLITLNLAKVRSLSAYIALGIALWIFIHESGIHATIAGVLVAFTIPTRSRINAAEFARDARVLLEQFERTETGDLLVLTSKGQQEAIGGLERACESVTPPLLQLEHLLHRFSAFVVMPLFALANAGVTLRGAGVDRVTLGVVVGLVIGKPLGILGGAASAVRFGLGALPPGVTWKGLYGCAWLGGIGFTMSLFIAALAFEGTQLVEAAKIGILGGSIVAGVVGASLMRHGLRSRA